jgi:hypothetical protein
LAAGKAPLQPSFPSGLTYIVRFVTNEESGFSARRRRPPGSTPAAAIPIVKFQVLRFIAAMGHDFLDSVLMENLFHIGPPFIFSPIG